MAYSGKTPPPTNKVMKSALDWIYESAWRSSNFLRALWFIISLYQLWANVIGSTSSAYHHHHHHQVFYYLKVLLDTSVSVSSTHIYYRDSLRGWYLPTNMLFRYTQSRDKIFFSVDRTKLNQTYIQFVRKLNIFF